MVAYAFREQVMSSLEIRNMTRARKLIDAKLEAGARSIEGLTHRRFYPERKTVTFDWPNYQMADPWELQLENNDLISVNTLTVAGVVIPPTDFFLRRWDNIDEPPYSMIQMNLASNSSFAGGVTFQRAINVNGIFGDKDTDTSVPSGSLGGGINSSVTTLIINPSGGNYPVGVGSIVLIGTERLVLTNRFMSDTAQNLQISMSADKSVKTVAVTDGTAFAIEETILIDAERMRIEDIAGNNLIVTRAVDSPTLASHTSPADIFALRTFTARRAALGTTAAAHSLNDPIYAHQFEALSPLINELNIAETVVMLEQNASAYARVVGSGSTQREAVGKGLEDLRCQVYTEHGRKGRVRAI